MTKKITIKDLEKELSDQLKLIQKLTNLITELTVKCTENHYQLNAVTERVNELSDLARYQQGFYD